MRRLCLLTLLAIVALMLRSAWWEEDAVWFYEPTKFVASGYDAGCLTFGFGESAVQTEPILRRKHDFRINWWRWAWEDRVGEEIEGVTTVYRVFEFSLWPFAIPPLLILWLRREKKLKRG